MRIGFYAKGFTLIEVMIALSVVAIGLMATLKAVNEEVSGANLTRNKMIALWVLENKVAEIRLNPLLPNIGINEGQQTLFNQTWQWQTNTTNTANTKIRKVEVSILQPNSKDKKDTLLKQSIYLGDLR
jgi:general secretion pathway protein I